MRHDAASGERLIYIVGPSGAGKSSLIVCARQSFYGIGTVINMPLRAGKTVVVNGSRANIAAALSKYPAMTVVQISVTPEVARARLNLRARENAEAISARVNRSPQFAAPSAQVITIDNSGVLERAAEQLMAVLLANGNLNHPRQGGMTVV